MTRAAVALTYRCNNACVFCAQAGIDAPVSDVEAALVEARRSSDEVTFIGGEPTLAPGLLDAIRRARALGFAKVGLQTNAAAVDVDAVVAAGLTDLHLSIHGATAAVHDYHTGIDGSFAALAPCFASNVPVVVTTVLTRSNFRAVAELPAWLKARGVAAWMLVLPHAAGRTAEAFDRVVPRLGMALPYALHALEHALALGIPSAIDGAPLCALGPKATLARRVPGPERMYSAEICGSCAARAVCGGVDSHYLDRFGPEELKPVDAPRRVPTMREDLGRMFVGAGPLVPREVPRHDAPAAARKRLPVLGRPNAGAAEVRGKQSGGAAKDLFPALFDDGASDVDT